MSEADLHLPSPEPAWAIAKRVTPDGTLMGLVRFRIDAMNQQSKFPLCACYTVDYPGDENGMPTPDTLAEIHKMQEKLQEQIEAMGHGAEVVSISGDNAYCTIYYVNDEQIAEAVLPSLPIKRAGLIGQALSMFSKKLSLDFEITNDPDWQTYRSLVPRDESQLDEAIELSWKWFQQNDKRLFELGQNNLEELLTELDVIKEFLFEHDLEFEIDARSKAPLELTISAGSHGHLFPLVEKLVDKAPRLANWKFIAFRQRMPKDELKDCAIGDPSADECLLAVSEMRFSLNKISNNCIGATLFVKAPQDNAELKENFSHVLLQQAIGEYDYVMCIESVKIEAVDSRNAKSAKPFECIAEEFDKLRE